MSEVEFKIGDVVVLKSIFEQFRSTTAKPYPLMTVDSIDTSDNVSYVSCTWFNKDVNEFKQSTFNKLLLMKNN